ncbi:MAG: Mrr restriction system protein [Chloroflexi bacterium ADurb.Bin360]|nr:MAG: Mrr restriction system protein [Chloroflexi bacterium ADurb.Bin360]
MKLLDAVEAVLTQAQTPMRAEQITDLILEQSLWESTGKTPDATVNARLCTDIKDLEANSRFKRTAPNTFALRIWEIPEYVPKTEADKKKAEIHIAVPEKQSTLSFTSAAEKVLSEYANKQPMHYRVITEKILELGLVNTQGQTPEATLYAQILTEVKRSTRRGETPRFTMHGKGMVGLRQWLGEGLGYQIQHNNNEVRKQLLNRLHAIAPDEFEGLIARLLVALGFEEVDITSYSKDGGIDVRGILVVGDVIRTRMAVQVKRWKNNLQTPTVQQVRGSLGTHEQGLIITTSDFSKGARQEAERPNAVPVALMNGQQLVDLLIENDIGIVRTPYDLIELEEA